MFRDQNQKGKTAMIPMLQFPYSQYKIVNIVVAWASELQPGHYSHPSVAAL